MEFVGCVPSEAHIKAAQKLHALHNRHSDVACPLSVNLHQILPGQAIPKKFEGPFHAFS